MKSGFRKKPLLIGGERRKQGLCLICCIIIDLFVNEVKAALRKYAKIVTPQDGFGVEMFSEAL